MDLINHVVTSTEEIAMEDIGRSEEAYIRVYGIELKTDTGRVCIEFRNSSNGYYGAEIKCTDEKGFSRFRFKEPVVFRLLERDLEFGFLRL